MQHDADAGNVQTLEFWIWKADKGAFAALKTAVLYTAGSQLIDSSRWQAHEARCEGASV
jgi:hypothetical protein